jgi:hypothetical protein
MARIEPKGFIGGLACIIWMICLFSAFIIIGIGQIIVYLFKGLFRIK